MFDTQARVPSGFTPDGAGYSNLYSVGVSYKPIPNVALKLDYRNFFNGNIADEFALGLGFAF